MKKAITVNINGYIFNIDEDAYTELKNWLDKISNQYKNEKDGDEIINDIEMRVAELFTDMVGDNGVVSIIEVNNVIKTMGQPEDFEDVSDNKQKGNESFSSYEKKKRYKNRRLFRDDENSVIAGVCSGLGYYFGIDPVLIRLAFILTIFIGGFGIITYIILWIVSPKATSTSQKLEMMGEPVNISNIEKAIKEEVEYFKDIFYKKKNNSKNQKK
ncbi:MAG: PspC domain-containing protein [Chlorobi bacterium]|nr:PspC domain-containing protein [Chlorobiota bacterium]